MDERLFGAAYTGNVGDLHQLLNEDPLVLHSVAVSSAETPLHVASISGHLNFVKEMIRLKPKFAGELNQNGFGPIHLASGNGYVEIVKELLMVNRDHCRFKSRDRRTPLHYAAIKGRIDVLDELISCCEESVGDVTSRGETALHLAVRNNQFGSFRFMVERLRQLRKEGLLNKKDLEGNTVLHLAISTKQLEVVELLLGSSVVEVNALNKTNLTVLDLLLILPNEASDRDIEMILRRAGAKRAWELAQSLDHQQVLEGDSNNEMTSEVMITESPLDHLMEFFKFQSGRDSPSDARTPLLVIAVLIATATYHACLSPPGGIWQGDGGKTTETNHNSTTTSSSDGLAILSTKDAISFGLFQVCNSVGFYASLSMIRILTSGFPLRMELEICIWAMGFTYITAMFTITPKTLLELGTSSVGIIVIPFLITNPFIAKWLRVFMEKKP